MRIAIAKGDLQTLRDVARIAIDKMENCSNPSAFGDGPKVGRKFIRKINRALKSVHGHDCNGKEYLT